MNPYDWQSHNPTAQIPRAEVEQAVEALLEGGSAVVLGGRGMGKSVFLRQVMAELQHQPSTAVRLIEAPPAALSVEACLEMVAQALAVPVDLLGSRGIFDRYFAREDAPERLILLFDEFDRYAEKGGPSAQPPGRGFFNDLEAARRSLPGLSILAAGSIGVFIFRDVLGSSFLARALYMHLRPFDRGAAETLAAPFEEQARPLPVEALDALYLASGGIPALLTYGLQQLWRQDSEPTARGVAAIYQAFEERYEEYLRDLLSALVDPRLSDAPRRVWEYVQEHAGRIPRADLEAQLGEPSGILRLDLTDALRLLEMSGAVRIEGSALRDDPVAVRPIAGLLNLPGRSPATSDRRQHFLRDLDALLVRLHRSSADFFRPGRGDEGKRLVPESVFAAYLALGFELLGWRSERETLRGAGRTDLLLRRNGDEGVYIVEVKLWGRNDYCEAHRQVESYWTDDVVAGAVVQLTDTEIDDWPNRYRRECLEPAGMAIEERLAEGSPVRARLSCSSTTGAGPGVRIEHFLVRVSRR
ncbi:MAG: hypothetical protein V3T72_14030 [Thermoanaerobaculia bacterium]